MIGSISSKGLKELFETGHSKRVRQDLQKRCIQILDALHYAKDLRDLTLPGLRLHPETKLFLGLVHATDGVEGARRRIAAAEKVVADFGIGTECGMGRRDPQTIPALLDLHARV